MIESTTFDPSKDAILNSPPETIRTVIPTESKQQTLPFDKLSWQNFERLCFRLADKSSVEFGARYGKQGQSQDGIDLFVRQPTGKYCIWQVKRHKSFSASDVKDAVNKFLAGEWAEKTEIFILATQCALDSKKTQDEIEVQAEKLKSLGNPVVFIPYDGEKLSSILKQYPDLVDDFFGRDWVRVFNGVEAAESLGAKLDGAEFSIIREQLKRYYTEQFTSLDLKTQLIERPFESDEKCPEFLNRYLVPDVLTQTDSGYEVDSNNQEQNSANSTCSAPRDNANSKNPRWRIPLNRFLSEGDKLAIVGEPGSGKSTLLRCVTLDLFFHKGVFAELFYRWGNLLPIYLPFSRWTHLSSKKGSSAGIKEVIEEVLQPVLTKDLTSLLAKAIDQRRIVLLVDGIDEWADEQAARVSFNYIKSFVTTHSIPILITGRQSALLKVGDTRGGWNHAEIAQLSKMQQRCLAELCLENRLGSELIASSVNKSPQSRIFQQFFSEVLIDQKFANLTANPLLLICLIALYKSVESLPTSKSKAIDNLVELLIEHRPVQRATESGSAYSRFREIPKVEDRKAVLAALAFESKKQSAGSINTAEAKQTIQNFLMNSPSLGFTIPSARNAAEEILCVNSESIGILRQLSKDEVAFSHAMFEDFLASKHILSWSDSDIANFVDSSAGLRSWSNVITLVLSSHKVNSEVDILIAKIEKKRESCQDPICESNIDLLIADIALNSALKCTTTKKRLLRRTVTLLERGAHTHLRQEILENVVSSIDELGCIFQIDHILESWTPKRIDFSASLFKALSKWTPSDDIKTAMLKSLNSEERDTQHGAACTLGTLFAEDDETKQELILYLKSANVSAVAAALEALNLGWSECPEIDKLNDCASFSNDPTLMLVGLEGRIRRNKHTDSDKFKLLELLQRNARLNYFDKRRACKLLCENFADDLEVLADAFKCVQRHGRRSTQFDIETASTYILHCSPANTKVTNWVLSELEQEHPFAFARFEAWDSLVPFLEVDGVREKLLSVLKSEFIKGQLFLFENLIPQIKDDEVKSLLVGIVKSKVRIDDYWALKLLLEGWSANDDSVKALLEAVAEKPHEELKYLASLLPEIYNETQRTRNMLFELGKHANGLLFYHIVHGFKKLGCDSNDGEVVDFLLALYRNNQSGRINLDPLFEYFHENPKVRSLAIELLDDPDPPFSAIAAKYQSDPVIRPKLLRVVSSLPSILRSDLIEFAASRAPYDARFLKMLKNYDLEADSELKISASILYHSTSSPVSDSESILKLIETLQATGLQGAGRRAAAFAGVLLTGNLLQMKDMRWYGDRLLPISTGGRYGKESRTLMRLIAEHWHTIKAVFGTVNSISDRFGELANSEDHLWDCIAPHLDSNQSAKDDFIRYCENTLSSLSQNGIIALSKERPDSELFKSHCLRTFDSSAARESPWHQKLAQLESAYLLQKYFQYDLTITATIRNLVDSDNQGAAIVALSLLSPDDPIFEQPDFSVNSFLTELDWLTAIHLSSRNHDSQEFVDVVRAMINRRTYSIWDFQEYLNRAIIERLRQDDESCLILRNCISKASTKHELCSIPKFLKFSVGLDKELNEHLLLLFKEDRELTLPSIGFDAFENSSRTVQQSIFEVLSPTLN